MPKCINDIYIFWLLPLQGLWSLCVEELDVSGVEGRSELDYSVYTRGRLQPQWTRVQHVPIHCSVHQLFDLFQKSHQGAGKVPRIPHCSHKWINTKYLHMCRKYWHQGSKHFRADQLLMLLCTCVCVFICVCQVDGHMASGPVQRGEAGVETHPDQTDGEERQRSDSLSVSVRTRAVRHGDGRLWGSARWGASCSKCLLEA